MYRKYEFEVYCILLRNCHPLTIPLCMYVRRRRSCKGCQCVYRQSSSCPGEFSFWFQDPGFIELSRNTLDFFYFYFILFFTCFIIIMNNNNKTIAIFRKPQKNQVYGNTEDMVHVYLITKSCVLSHVLQDSEEMKPTYCRIS